MILGYKILGEAIFSTVKDSTLFYSPEWPEVSMAVTKNRTYYSVSDACSTHMAPIHPPAFTNIYCISQMEGGCG